MIDILMATYNGEKYIEEQIISILKQSVCDWNLIIQDDCSNDKTVDIIKKYAERYPDKIKYYLRKHQSGSAYKNFFSMIKYSNAEYVMFADQDDVWKEDKIESTLQCMKSLEKKYYDVPLLVYTDFIPVNKNLQPIGISWIEESQHSESACKKEHIIVDNIGAGCTMMFNGLLRDKLHTLPDWCIMHDYWVALVAAFFGKISYLDKKTILYRQHESNVMGTRKNTIFWRFNIKRIINARKILKDSCRQIKIFFTIYQAELSNYDKDMLKIYSDLYRHSWVVRIFYICKYDFWRQTFLAKLLQLF